MVGQPVVHLANGDSYSAGKAFAIRWFRGRTILVSPLHLLGPAGGLEHYIEPTRISAEVREIEVRDLFDRSTLVRVNKSLLTTGIPVEKGTGDVSTDLMAFEIQGSCSLHVFNLSATLPAVGTRVHLATCERGSSGVRYFKGVITKSSNTGLVIKMNEDLQPGASSGAPVIDDKNQLVAMMVGHQTNELIVAVPVNRIYERLYKVLGGK
ncbi:MAG: hypothetical protein K2Z81_13030 [Cyanobacteria bacterium]|nr:hypothetical protein [Cyanobacteriota bacterium]